MKGIIRLLSVVMTISVLLAGCAREETTDSEKALAGWVSLRILALSEIKRPGEFVRFALSN